MKRLLLSALCLDGLFVRIDRFPFTLGRSRSADGRLPLVFVSRSHCRFSLLGDEVVVEDLSSANGTSVNGVPVSQATPLHDGDELHLGPLGLRVLLQDTEAGTPAVLSA